MSEFKTIPLKEIKPDPNQPRKFFNPVAQKELTESVKSKGVLQAILVRPNGTGYILVCGERRLKAAIAAGLPDIPATIRTLNDEEALEIQFIENIQRDDVHPMDEAVTFKAMMENKLHPYTLEDIGAKINKPATYVAHRLALNNLIEELQKDFWAGKFLIGHAVLFARLAQEDQKSVAKECKEWNSKEYKSVNEVKSYITRNIMRELSASPFKKDDPELNPEMGPCTTCAFRSGSNPTLFNDIKESDRCLKPGCFSKKINAHVIKAVKTALETEPETRFLFSSYSRDTAKEIVALLKAYNVTPIQQYDHFSYHGSKGDVKTKGIWINSDKAGQMEYVFLSNQNLKAAKGEKTKDGKPTNAAIDAEIEGIKQRTKRAAEFDDEKVWRHIHDEVITDKALVNESPLSNIDTASVLFAMAKNAGYGGSDKIKKVFGGGTEKQVAEKMLTATQKQFNQACRIFSIIVLDSAQSSHTACAGQGLLKQVAEQYHKEKISAFEIDQQQKRAKREERAKQRIAALQEQKKEVKPKKVETIKTTPPPAAGARQNPKKAVKKAGKKK